MLQTGGVFKPLRLVVGSYSQRKVIKILEDVGQRAMLDVNSVFET